MVLILIMDLIESYNKLIRLYDNKSHRRAYNLSSKMIKKYGRSDELDPIVYYIKAFSYRGGKGNIKPKQASKKRSMMKEAKRYSETYDKENKTNNNVLYEVHEKHHAGNYNIMLGYPSLSSDVSGELEGFVGSMIGILGSFLVGPIIGYGIADMTGNGTVGCFAGFLGGIGWLVACSGIGGACESPPSQERLAREDATAESFRKFREDNVIAYKKEQKRKTELREWKYKKDIEIGRALTRDGISNYAAGEIGRTFRKSGDHLEEVKNQLIKRNDHLSKISQRDLSVNITQENTLQIGIDNRGGVIVLDDSREAEQLANYIKRYLQK